MWEFEKGWDTKGVEAGRGNIFCKNSIIGGSNGEVIFGKCQDPGQGCAGNEEVPGEDKTEIKARRKCNSTASGEGGGGGYVCLGEEDREVPSSKVKPEVKWVSGCGVSVSVYPNGGGRREGDESSLNLDYYTTNEK
eukprot:scaffold11331_cov82-Skeletonema_dohrnii-CCMP3373.AAC.2